MKSSSKESKVIEKDSTIYIERQQLARNMCLTYSNINEWKQLVPEGRIWSYGYPNGIHYCLLPKVGCTYWKRIFLFLHKDFPQNMTITRPSQIPRSFVHIPNKKIHTTEIKHRVNAQILSNNKFMFSRDPYSRLWSAYIDKLYLPDFWKLYGMKILNSVRQNASLTERSFCGKNVTFLEFLVYVASNVHWNPHWTPIYRICSPCHIQYDVIGHQETFSTDAKYILNKYGHGNLIEKVDPESRVDDETSMLIKYNFKFNGTCYNKLDIAKRLWKAFQYNGYIHKDIEFPQHMNFEMFNKQPIEEFSKHLKSIFELQIKQGVNLKTQKQEMMFEAYKKIPRKVLQKLKDIYKFDFELFGYDPEPKQIFS